MSPEVSFKVVIFEQTVKKILHICLGQERIKGTEKASPIHTLFHR